MSEFSFIDQYCYGIGAQHPATHVGVGDDAAVVSIPSDMELVVSVDTMVEGVHFFSDASPEDIAYKLMTVNLSDMAAMGADPKWATLALTVPSLDEHWLARFYRELNEVATYYGVQLIGGDTTQGAMTLSLNIMGLVLKGVVISRSKARLGDDLYVTNTLGDAALGLRLLQTSTEIPSEPMTQLLTALNRPLPQVEVGMALRSIASAGLDISDGLIGDLEHIARQSDVGLKVEVDQIPVSSVFSQFSDPFGGVDLAMTGGDDYQLAFTAAVSARAQIEKISRQTATPLTRIGTIIEPDTNKLVLLKDGQPYKLAIDPGFQHFS